MPDPSLPYERVDPSARREVRGTRGVSKNTGPKGVRADAERAKRAGTLEARRLASVAAVPTHSRVVVGVPCACRRRGRG